MVLATLPATGAFAAALDRSGQSMSAFLQPGNYFEAGLSVLDADVSGTTKANYPNAALPLLSNTSVGEMADSYQFAHAALKLQLADQLSFGLIYDQPFGAKATYSTDTAKLPAALPGAAAALQGQGAFHNGTQGTSVEVETQNLSMILGFQPNKNFNIYAGPVYQTIKGNVQLRGAAYGSANGLGLYNADLDEDGAVGWLAGFAYQIPEIALKTSITYRSEIDHKASAREYGQSNVLAFVGSSPVYDVATDANITTPQSVNLDFQTGIMANTVAFANVRWVNWKDFSLDLKQFGTVADTLGALGQTPDNPNGFDIVGYTDDQWSANVGVGRKFNDLWAGNVSVGWDSGAGNPISTLGPTEGYWNVGLGLQYSPTPATFIAGGVKYFWLGDAKAQAASNFGSDTYVAEFNDNDALAYGLKIGYKF